MERTNGWRIKQWTLLGIVTSQLRMKETSKIKQNEGASNKEFYKVTFRGSPWETPSNILINYYIKDD